jgi:hypothetical protein
LLSGGGFDVLGVLSHKGMIAEPTNSCLGLDQLCAFRTLFHPAWIRVAINTECPNQRNNPTSNGPTKKEINGEYRSGSR